MNKIKYFIILTLIFVTFISCGKKEDTIKVGLVVGLSGKYSVLGSGVRDGVILAFEEIKYKVNNLHIKLIQKDDMQDEKQDQKVINELLKEDVKIIIGNATSSMTAVSIQQLKKHQDILLMSATASSQDFSHLDDNFLRIQVEHSKKRYKALLKYLHKHKHKNVFVIYDSKNLSYAKGYFHFFQDMIVQTGGNKFVASVDLNTNYEDILKKLKSTKHDLILIVGNSVDTANILQYIRLHGINTKVLASGWAKTIDFIQNGGKAVEGVIFSTGYDDNSKDIVQRVSANAFEAEIIPLHVDDFVKNIASIGGDVTHAIFSVDGERFSELLVIAHDYGISVGFIPLPSQKEQIKNFYTTSNIDTNIEIALRDDAKFIDLVKVNDKFIYNQGVVGTLPFVSKNFKRTKNSFFEQLFYALKKFVSLKVQKFEITTFNGQKIVTSGTALIVLNHTTKSFISKIFKGTSKKRDAKVTVVIISPSSVFEYIQLLISVFKISTNKKTLPKSIGYM